MRIGFEERFTHLSQHRFKRGIAAQVASDNELIYKESYEPFRIALSAVRYVRAARNISPFRMPAHQAVEGRHQCHENGRILTTAQLRQLIRIACRKLKSQAIASTVHGLRPWMIGW